MVPAQFPASGCGPCVLATLPGWEEDTGSPPFRDGGEKDSAGAQCRGVEGSGSRRKGSF